MVLNAAEDHPDGRQSAARQARLPAVARRWVVERDFGGMSRFWRLARDQERLAHVLQGFHVLAFSMLMGKHVLPVLSLL